MDLERLLLIGGIVVIIGILLYYGWKGGYLDFVKGFMGKKTPLQKAADEEKKFTKEMAVAEHKRIDEECKAMHEAVVSKLAEINDQIDRDVEDAENGGDANGDSAVTNSGDPNGEGFIRFRNPIRKGRY